MFTVGLYYLKYAIGIYGWPIHVFLNPCCGLGGLCHLARYILLQICMYIQIMFYLHYALINMHKVADGNSPEQEIPCFMTTAL